MFYVGVVEDRNDPLQLGRVRVRIVGYHSASLADIPLEGLPWATVMMPNTGSSTTGISETPAIVEGTWVMVSFLDQEMQSPIILGTIPGLTNQKPNEASEIGFKDPNNVYPIQDRLGFPDIHPRTRGNNYEDEAIFTGVSGLTAPDEGWDAFAAEYPYNQVKATEAGHYKEYDNTPDKERIKEYHMSGTYYEVQPDGTILTHIVKDRYNIILGNDTAWIQGDVKIVVGGDADIQVTGDTTVTCEQNVEVGAGRDIILGAEDDIQITGWNVKIDSSSSGRIDFNYAPQTYTIDLENFVYGEPQFGSPGGAATEGSAAGGPYVGAVTKYADETFVNPVSSECSRSDLGSISAKYESVGDAGAIGYDSVGGASYGKYQIASNTGTMEHYMAWLEAYHPDTYAEFDGIGTYTHNSKAEAEASPFGKKWKELAADSEFEQLQHDFIKATHYDPMVSRIKKATGHDLCDGTWGPGIQDAVWSTSVQHGPNSSIPVNAFLNAGSGTESDVINALYDDRSNVNKYFSSSSQSVKDSVSNRFTRERRDALRIAES